MNSLQVAEAALPELKEWNGERVVTFKDIDTVHKKKSGAASRNFRNNKKHFIENEDYFSVTREQCNGKTFPIGNIPPKGITLLTESGYLMIVKSFDDDLSWSIQRMLVNSYFRQKEQAHELVLPPEEDFPAIPQHASVPAPLLQNWYDAKRDILKKLSVLTNTPEKTIGHYMLLKIGRTYNIDAMRQIYEREKGFPPRYATDIILFFPEIESLVDGWLEKILGEVQK